MTPQCKKMIDDLGRRYADLGLPDQLVRAQAELELHQMILRAWEAGATLQSMADSLGISRQGVAYIKDRAIRERSMVSPLERELTQPVDDLPPTCVEVPVYRLGDDDPSFVIKFRGRRIKEFMAVPGGSAPIHAVLLAHGLDPEDYWTSPFFIREVAA